MTVYRRHRNSRRHHHHYQHRTISRSLLLLLAFCTVFHIATADSGGTNPGDEKLIVKGVVGQSASLHCVIDEEHCGPIYFLTWSKLERNDHWSRIYVFSDESNNKPLSGLEGRARFSRQNSHLDINLLKPSDDALYKCDVTYVAGKCPSLTFVQLQIIAKPIRSWIEHEGDLLQNGHRLSLTEGDLLKLACSVLGGKPQAVITWLATDSRGRTTVLKRSGENGSPLHELVGDSDTMTLVLTKKLTRDYLNARIECHVEHEAIKDNSLDSSVVVDVNVGIKTMEIIGPSTSIREGDVAVIECVAYGSKPAAEIVWRNGSRIIDGRSTRTTEEANIDRITVNTRSKLEIIVGSEDHLNPITCEAANVAMRTPIHKSTEISVLFAPIVTMEPENGLVVNESTSMVSIYCTYQANPSTLLHNETVWYKDGHVLDTTNSDHYATNFAESPVLTILDVTRGDSGHYYCSMANELGSGVPQTYVHLNVLYPPTVSLLVHPTPSADYQIKEGDNLRMICDITDGNPRNASRMRWLKNNGETVSELDSETSTQKELTWLSITRSLTGNYTCQAISDAGISKPSNEVEIVVHYPPGKSIIRLLDEPYAVKGKNITLECIVNDPGRPDNIEFHWENSDGMIFESRKSILHIANIRLVNRGNISCSAVNQIGFGPRGHYELIPYAPPSFINALPPVIGVNENFRSGDSSTSNDGTFAYDDTARPIDTTQTISAYCRVECFPSCHIQWYRNNQLLDNSTGEHTITETILPEEFLLNRFPSVVSTLTWNLSSIGHLDRVRDSGITYSCISSDNMVGPAVQSNTKFQVEYAPENLRLSSSRVDVIENEMLPEIRCESDALPPASYRWISNSFYDKFTGIIADTPTLTLNRTIGRDSGGTYTCIASNRHGERRIDLQVNVLYKPACTIYESRTGKDNQDVLLICEVTSANPDSGFEYHWTFNGTSLNQTFLGEISTEEGYMSKIVIPTTDDSLFGTWTCSVRNTVGQTEPNCTLFVDAPLLIPEWSALGDESILIISAVIVAIIIAFVFILLCLIYLMRRRRHKNEKEKRDNLDGSRSPTPSSSTSRVSSNQNDLISTKSQASSKKAADTERLSSSNSSGLGTSASGEMYENMTFHRKPSNCMPHMNGSASAVAAAAYFHHQHQTLHQRPSSGLQHTPSMHSPLPPAYDHATNPKLTNEFRRTQSARFTANQSVGRDMDDILYADIYEDVKSGKIADPRAKPKLPPKPGTKDSLVKPPKLPSKKTLKKKSA